MSCFLQLLRQFHMEINYDKRHGEGGSKGRKAAGAARPGGTGNTRRRRDGTDGAWISMRVSENGFSKYSGKTASTGRNRPRFAIQAHCGLLVTSVSPNCCFKNGILRKSHFPAPSSFETTARCLCLPPSLPAPSQLFRPSWLSSVVLIFI